MFLLPALIALVLQDQPLFLALSGEQAPRLAAGMWRVDEASGVREICLAAPTAPEMAFPALRGGSCEGRSGWVLYRPAFWVRQDTCRGPGRSYAVAYDLQGDLAGEAQLRINLAPLPLKRSGQDDIGIWRNLKRLGAC